MPEFTQFARTELTFLQRRPKVPSKQITSDIPALEVTIDVNLYWMFL
jgi:hypothetical protein